MKRKDVTFRSGRKRRSKINRLSGEKLGKGLLGETGAVPPGPARRCSPPSGTDHRRKDSVTLAGPRLGKAWVISNLPSGDSDASVALLPVTTVISGREGSNRRLAANASKKRAAQMESPTRERSDMAPLYPADAGRSRRADERVQTDTKAGCPSLQTIASAGGGCTEHPLEESPAALSPRGPKPLAPTAQMERTFWR